MWYLIGYTIIGFILGMIITKIEKDSFPAVIMFLLWPLFLPIYLLDQFFEWIAKS